MSSFTFTCWFLLKKRFTLFIFSIIWDSGTKLFLYYSFQNSNSFVCKTFEIFFNDFSSQRFTIIYVNNMCFTI